MRPVQIAFSFADQQWSLDPALSAVSFFPFLQPQLENFGSTAIGPFSGPLPPPNSERSCFSGDRDDFSPRGTRPFLSSALRTKALPPRWRAFPTRASLLPPSLPLRRSLFSSAAFFFASLSFFFLFRRVRDLEVLFGPHVFFSPPFFDWSERPRSFVRLSFF